MPRNRFLRSCYADRIPQSSLRTRSRKASLNGFSDPTICRTTDRNSPADAGHNPCCNTSTHHKPGTFRAYLAVLPGFIVPRLTGEWYCFLPLPRVFTVFSDSQRLFQKALYVVCTLSRTIYSVEV